MQNQNDTHNLSRLVIDNIKPKWVTCLWLLFFVIMGALFLLVLAVPESFIKFQYHNFSNCPSDMDNLSQFCQKFQPDPNRVEPYWPYYSVFVTGMSNRNQFAIIDIEPIKSITSPEFDDSYDLKLNFALDVYEVDKNNREQDKIYTGFSHGITIPCYDTRSKYCDNRTVLYLNRMDRGNYLVVFNITNPEYLASRIDSIQSYITSVNPSYTDFLLALRYVCLAISIGFIVFYWRGLRRMRGEKLVFEQKFIRVLGILLIFFNDPIYASTILQPTLASAVFSVMFILTFFCALLLFWIAAFQRIYRDNTTVHSKALSWQKLTYIGLLWLFSVVAYCILSREYLNDPSFDFNDEYENAFTVFKVIMIILLGVGLAWMFYGFAQILRNYNALIWRHKIFFSFSCYFILCYFIFAFTGSVNVYNLNGSKVLLFIGITNLYVWFLQILYIPYGSAGQFAGSNTPISLSEGLKEFQGYEVLDENSGIQADHFQNEEERSPDQIIFQIDENGNLEKREQGSPQKQQSNFNNFGVQNANSNSNSQVFNLEMAIQGQQEESGEIQYPFDANHDDDVTH